VAAPACGGRWRLQSAEAQFQVTLPIDPSRAIELSGRIDRIDVRGMRPRIDLSRSDRLQGALHRAVRAAAADPARRRHPAAAVRGWRWALASPPRAT